jgi:hypothetical protein
VDRSQHALSALDELGQIQYEIRLSRSLSDLRRYFDRVQKVRRTYADDFDVQLLAADVQDAIIERARSLREQSGTAYLDDEPIESNSISGLDPEKTLRSHAVAEIPPEVPRLDRKNWQRAIYLALLFTVLICAVFFYLIQTARRINLPESLPGALPAASQQNGRTAAENTLGAAGPEISTKPTLRLYTDLVPGTVSLDNGPPQDLKDGELVLDNLQPGRHNVRVTGQNGSAGFDFDVSQKAAPQIIGTPTAVNAMAVLVSAQDGKGRLYTNAPNAALLIDGKPAGDVGPDGLALDDLGKADHDLQVTRDRDRQRFVLTYTPAPALTAYVKSDPNIGTVVVMTGRDGVNVFINDKPYRRLTAQGQIRIPLKVGEYTIRVHKDGFTDPPPQTAEVRKAEETEVAFRLDPVPQFGSLQVRGAAPGTAIYIDKQLAGTADENGNVSLTNVKVGEHIVELHQNNAVPKRLLRTFSANAPVVLSGPDVQLDQPATAKTNNPVAAPPSPAPAAEPPPETTPQTGAIPADTEQIRKGGGFVPYSTPKVAGRYSFRAHGRLGGFLKHGKLQWYAGYHDTENYILFTVDGKHATVREIQGGKSTEISRIPFSADSGEWIQVEMSVKPTDISARIRNLDGTWSNLGSVTTPGRDFTQDKVGFYIPGNEEVAVSNFKFASH